MKYDLVTIIVGRGRPDLTDGLYDQVKRQTEKIANKIIVVESGHRKYKDRTPLNMDIWYHDDPFKGKCFAHNVGLEYIFHANITDAKYYLFLMNDIEFMGSRDILNMIDCMEERESMGLLSPTNIGKGGYPHCRPQDSPNGFRMVATVDYLALMISNETLHHCGFLSSRFRYCWGAIHQYAYILYKNQKYIAYCDDAVIKHLGASTYGEVPGVPSREEYIREAKKFAREFFVKYYGENWDDDFTNILPGCLRDPAFNTFKMHRAKWESEE